MNRLLFLFLLVSTVSYGQLKCCFSVPVPPTYVAIPSAPTLTSPTVIVPSDPTYECCGGGIFTPPGGSTAGGDIIPTGNFLGSPGGFSARQWDGDATHIWRVVPASGSILGTASGSGHGWSQTDHGNYQYLYGLSAAAPGVVKGQFGVFFTANTAGGHWLVQNFVAKSTTAGSFQANAGNSGGAYYDTLRYTFCRSFTSGQEGLYEGFTSANYAKCNRLYVKHFFAYNSNREGLQVKGDNSADVSNVTVVGAGQGHVAAQDRNFQWDDSNGRLHHSVFEGGFEGAQIFSHGSQFDHLYINWSNDGVSAGISLGRTDNQASFDLPSSRLNGDSVIFDAICFKKSGTVAAYAINVQLRDAPIIIRNCTFDNISAASGDNRVAGFTNTITGAIGDHGNVSGTCATPTFVTGYNDPDDHANQGLLLTSSTWYLNHYGYRSP